MFIRSLVKRPGEVQICVGPASSSLPRLWRMQLGLLLETAPELLAELDCPQYWHQWTHWHRPGASSAQLLLLALQQQEAPTQQAGAGERKSTVSFLLPRRLVFGAQSHFLPRRENGALRGLACHLQNCFHLHPVFPSSFLLHLSSDPGLFAVIWITCYNSSPYSPVPSVPFLLLIFPCQVHECVMVFVYSFNSHFPDYT